MEKTVRRRRKAALGRTYKDVHRVHSVDGVHAWSSHTCVAHQVKQRGARCSRCVTGNSYFISVAFSAQYSPVSDWRGFMSAFLFLHCKSEHLWLFFFLFRRTSVPRISHSERRPFNRCCGVKDKTSQACECEDREKKNKTAKAGQCRRKRTAEPSLQNGKGK